MPWNLLRRKNPKDENEPTEKKKLRWSERFFIFAAVMFLLGWASTGIMSSAKDIFDFGSSREQPQNINPPNILNPLNAPDSTNDVEYSTPADSNFVPEQLTENAQETQSVPDDLSTPPPAADIYTNNTTPPLSSPVNWGDWGCVNCVAVPVRVKLTHYWPPLGGDNCWSFYDDYCYSPTKSTVPWETVIEIAAACPVPWLGSVVEIPALERRYLCLDTGDKVVCKDGTCIVDVLTDKIYPWDGLEFEAIIYYPKVWVEPAPTFTPAITPDQ